MTNASSGVWFRAARYAAAVALLCGSQISWGEDKAPAGAEAPTSDRETFVPREDVGPVPLEATDGPNLQPKYQIPHNLADPAFKHFVDMNLLGDAYLNNSAALMVDVGLQLMEAERVLYRSLDGLKSREVLDVALRMATEQRDTATLDRLSQFAEKSGDKEWAAKLALSRQLAGQSRAAAPPLPEPSDTLSSDDIIMLQQRLVRLERASAVDDLHVLRMLQDEFKTSTINAPEFNDYLKSEVSKKVATLTPAEANPDPVVAMLGELSGVSRGESQYLLSTDTIGTKRKGVYRHARAYRLNATNDKIWVDYPNNQGEWRPRHSLDGIKARYGSVYINPGSYMEIVVDANGKPIPDGKYETTRTKPGKSITIDPQNPNVVKVMARNPVKGGWWPAPSITFDEAILMHLETKDGKAGPARFGATPIVSVNRELQPMPRIIAAAGSYLKWREIAVLGSGGTTVQEIQKSGGEKVMIPPLNGANAAISQKAAAMPGGLTAANIVAAGGGNLNVDNIVAAGGGNIVAAGGGNIVAAGGGNIVAAGGGNIVASVHGNIVAAGGGNAQQRLAFASSIALVVDQGRTLIGKGGAGLVGQDGASISAMIQASPAVEPAKVFGLVGIGSSTNPYFSGAARVD